MATGDKDIPPIYESQPPKWLPKAHGSADLGYVSFFPPRPDQEEDILTVSNVKDGFQQPPVVPAETYTARDTVKPRLSTENALSELEDLMAQIFARKAENVPPIPPSSFKLPSRVTMNDAKREAWFTDLANPNVPLHKLSKSVPHGAKGHDLLDLLQQNNVAIPRAVWFLRVFGGNETAGLRNRPQYIPTQYSVDWANVVCGYLKKQLTEIALPMAPRPGLNVKQSFKGVLSDQASRDRWVSRFTYSLSLLRVFYAEGMVDHRTFLAWVVQQCGTCNLAQLGFVIRLADEYLDGMLVCHALVRPLVEACTVRLSEIRSATVRDHLDNVEHTLKAVLLRCLLGLRDGFVNPRLWAQHSLLFEEVLREHISRTSSESRNSRGTPALNDSFLAAYEDVKRRNDAMLFRNIPPRVLGSLSSALSDIKLLNSLSCTSSMESCPFFDGILDPSPAFVRKLDILLTWSVTPLQYGDHRPHAAASLLRLWRDRAEERAARRERESPADDVQDHLFDWLDTSEVAGEDNSLASVALLFDQFVKNGLFDYGQYIQHLIARGEQGLSFTDTTPSRHRRFLQWIPLHSSSSPLISQRKVALYGLRVRETPEDRKEREIRRQIRAVLPELFGGEVPDQAVASVDIAAQVPGIFTATRFEQVRLFRGWLLPVLKKAVSAHTKGTEYPPALRAYCTAVTVMARSRHYGIILELTLFALEHAMSNEFLLAILQTLRQHVEVWGCMNKMKDIEEALYATHNFWKTRGVQSRDLLTLLFAIDNGQHLDQVTRAQLIADHEQFIRAFHPVGERPVVVPAVLPEILLLVTDPNPETPSILANSLWYKYRSAPDWAWKVWDNTVASLRQIPSMIEDPAGRRSCALRYSTFLIHVDRHLATGLDEHVLGWLRGSGKNEVAALSTETWDLFVVVLLHLASSNALAVTSLLEGLVYPAWQTASTLSSPQQGASMEIILPVVNDLCTRLLLIDGTDSEVPPLDFLQYHGLQTGRRDVYRGPYFAALVKIIPTLVLLEHNINIPEHLRQGCGVLRVALCSSSVFRMGTFRELDTVHDAFQAVLANPEVPEEKHEPLIAALKLIFNEGQQEVADPYPGWGTLSSFLSPWKLAATSIELRFTMRQFNEALQRPAYKDRAERSLSKLAITLFGQGMDSEQADFVAEMIRGVNPVVVGKFVNAGLQRIAEILKEGTPLQITEDLHRNVGKAGKVLRLLTNLVEPMRAPASTTSLPQVDSPAPRDLISVVQGLLQGIADRLSSSDIPESSVISDHDSVRRMIAATIFLARVVQFVLGFPGAWMQWAKDHCENLSQILSRLILVFGSGTTLDVIAFPLLLDTLYYLLDEIPVDPKATTIDPFRCYPVYELRSLPLDMPFEYRSRIRALIPYVEPNLAVADLAYVSRDPSGSISSSEVSLVHNKPWEWTEYLGDVSGADTAKENVETRALQPSHYSTDQQPVIRNSSSLSLDLFAARVIGTSSAPAEDARVESELRMLQDDFLAESVFRRDFRETRVDPSVIGAKVSPAFNVEDGDAGNALAPSGSDRRSSSRAGSPSGSVRSRASIQPSTASGSRQTSPATTRGSQQRSHSGLSKLAGTSMVEPIDVDMLDLTGAASRNTAGTKRKTAEVDDDDEVEIVERSAVASQSKRVKGKPKSKNR
ncbi:uncharacterized protein PHACADRAFT_196411 [Phanerochaete carnosa HHB-10118-sp]|uniref:Mediator of RNA polymerase II transcription subunit 12 n=1 Tax=Phanerochaete carnosa (strain HHB-10118-sp) TaxID=650164 RepID=K5W4V6_PHACS|nr:uncharacterized protein PHACADRAFT_196411 [Phanerochaete carnosa HHB-10118-sp]EKM53974.1 hypothetical protein PHACADRAFT_196411 [Phanerochaete carnosa HHB-10118-sp]